MSHSIELLLAVLVTFVVVVISCIWCHWGFSFLFCSVLINVCILMSSQSLAIVEAQSNET